MDVSIKNKYYNLRKEFLNKEGYEYLRILKDKIEKQTIKFNHFEFQIDMIESYINSYKQDKFKNNQKSLWRWINI